MNIHIPLASLVLGVLLVTHVGLQAETAGVEPEGVLAARRTMLDAVARDGKDAFPVLKDGLAHESELVTRTAAHLLAAYQPPFREGLEALLVHPDIKIRRIAVRRIAVIGWLPEYWGEILLDAAPAIRREARLSLLGTYLAPLEGEARETVAAAFERAYQSDDVAVRRHVIETLADWTGPGEPGWRLLRKAVGDADTGIREFAFEVVTTPDIERMQALARSREWETLLAEYGDEAFDGWMDRELARQALYLRGQAHYHQRNGEQAKADLEASIAIEPHQRVISLLGDNARRNFEDPERALERYLQALDSGTHGVGHVTYRTILSAAAILRAEGRYDAALEVLERSNPEGLTQAWASNLYLAIGQTLVAQGRPEKAMTRYRELLDSGRVSGRNAERVRQALEALENPPQAENE